MNYSIHTYNSLEKSCVEKSQSLTHVSKRDLKRADLFRKDNSFKKILRDPRLSEKVIKCFQLNIMIALSEILIFEDGER